MVTIPTTTHCPPSAYLNSLQRVRRHKWNIDCQNIWDLRGMEGENQKHAYWKCCSSLDLKYWYTTVEHSWGLTEVYQVRVWYQMILLNLTKKIKDYFIIDSSVVIRKKWKMSSQFSRAQRQRLQLSCFVWSMVQNLNWFNLLS